MLKATTFSALCDFINSKPTDEVISRKDIVEHVVSKCPNNSIHSIDNYRNYMTNAGYLEIVSTGKYKKLKELPNDLTTSKLLSEAYPKPFSYIDELIDYERNRQRYD